MNIRYVVAASVAALMAVIPLAYTSAEESPERTITLVGCVIQEHEYRRTYGPGGSGPQGPGIGGRDEFVLVDAREVAPGTPIPADEVDCPAVSTFPTAYELTGKSEDDLEAYLGRRVELTGIQKEADIDVPVGTTGVSRPTGGADPLGHELHLFEVEVESFRDVTIARAEAAPVVVPEREVEVEAEVFEPEPEIVAEVEPEFEEAPVIAQREELPRTASPLPLAGLIGLLALAGAAGLRSLSRRHH